MLTESAHLMTWEQGSTVRFNGGRQAACYVKYRCIRFSSYVPFMKYLRSVFSFRSPFRYALPGFLAGLLFVALSGCVELFSFKSSAGKSSQTSTVQAAPAADAGLLLLLVPEGQVMADPMVTAWIDAGSELGVRIRPVTGQQFRAMADTALRFAGLILPDRLHVVADDALLNSIREYTQAGGQTLLVYDFGTMALNRKGERIFAIPKSRLSDLAGVDYALYDSLLEKSIVVGTVAAMRSTLRELQVPPGKSSLYELPDPLDKSRTALANRSTLWVRGVETPGVYKPVSSTAPSSSKIAINPAETADVLESYSGYLLGNLTYASFVTRGAYDGVVMATSAEAGLIAGLNRVGLGQVLFVNLPLTKLKVERTDGLPMHGFLRYFAHNVLQMAHLSAVPDAIGGLTLNWHLDSLNAQLPTLRLEKLGVFDAGPFSINMTTGPDAIKIGDGRGWDLDNNPTAQQILQRFAKKGHALGSHGGWNHDYYGSNVSETNSNYFLPYLEKNMDSIRRAVSSPARAYMGFESSTPEHMPPALLATSQKLKALTDRSFGPLLREYSAPMGNNPMWALDWLDQQGVIAAYFAGHTGLGPTRQYREGKLRNPDMWVFPVTPFGRFATFEEFQRTRHTKEAVMDWYRSSIDFAMAHNTTRMVYMHPPGADLWADVVLDFLAYANAQGEQKFRWYTMTRLADFMTSRRSVTWTEQRGNDGLSRFDIDHESSLKEMVWLLPKSRFAEMPVSKGGSVTVSDMGANWAVRAGNTRRASFTAVNAVNRL